jgi:hypothetical protein
LRNVGYASHKKIKACGTRGICRIFHTLFKFHIPTYTFRHDQSGVPVYALWPDRSHLPRCRSERARRIGDGVHCRIEVAIALGIGVRAAAAINTPTGVSLIVFPFASFLSPDT